MKIKYSKEADILLIQLREGTPEDAMDLQEGVILHLDHENKPLEIELLDASHVVALDEFHLLGAIAPLKLSA